MKKVLKATFIIFSSVLICIALSASALAAKEGNALKLTAKNVSDGIKLTWSSYGSCELYGIYRTEGKNKSLITKTSALTYTDKNVKNKKTYTYSVVPFDKKGNPKDSSTADSIMRLSTPELHKYTNTSSGIKLTWTRSEGAKGYRIFRRTNDSKKWKQVGKTNADTLSFKDKNVSPENSYTYIVKGYNGNSLSRASERLKAEYIKAAEIKKFTVNKSSISFTWQKQPKASAYEIYRTTPDSSKATLYAKVNADTLIFTDENVSVGKKYGYSVRTVHKNGRRSAVAKPSYCLMMKTPKIKKATNVTEGIKLTWSKTPSAQSYNVYRRDAGSDSTAWKKIISTKALTATDTSALNSKKYVYIVRAVYNGIQSDFATDGYTACFLSAPSQLTVEYLTKTSNRLSWSANSNATAYNIYRRAENSTEWIRIKRTSKTSYTDKNAESGKVYAYYVRSYIKTKYKSAASNVVYSSIVNPKGKMVALTYDDGPSNNITPLILNTLEKYGARATFFVLGSRIEANSEPLKRAVSLGCEIGNHTYGHINLPSYEKEEIEKEIRITNNLVKKYTGTVPKLARAPGGSTSTYSAQAVNMPFIYWSIDTRDWETMDADSIIAHIKNETRDGSIILMHDLYQTTAQATEVIVPWLVEEGYQLVTVSEIMQYRNIKLENAVTYYNAYPKTA